MAAMQIQQVGFVCACHLIWENSNKFKDMSERDWRGSTHDNTQAHSAGQRKPTLSASNAAGAKKPPPTVAPKPRSTASGGPDATAAAPNSTTVAIAHATTTSSSDDADVDKLPPLPQARRGAPSSTTGDSQAPEEMLSLTQLAEDTLADVAAGAAGAGTGVLFTIYDLGGQTVFYDLLQLLLSRCVQWTWSWTYRTHLICCN